MKLEGAKYLFGTSATATLPVLDVVYNTPQINYIQSQHEQGATRKRGSVHYSG